MEQEYTRTLSTLLILLREHIKKYGVHEKGLCHLIDDMFFYNHINNQEFDKLSNYINDNPPINFYRIVRKLGLKFQDNYHWEPGNMEVRIKWLNKHIKKLQNKNS